MLPMMSISHNLIDEGTFGSVFKGTLVQQGNKKVALKVSNHRLLLRSLIGTPTTKASVMSKTSLIPITWAREVSLMKYLSKVSKLVNLK